MNTRKQKKGRHPIIGFQIKRDTLAKVDQLAKAQGISRSDVFRIIVEKYLNQESLLDKVAS